MKNKKKILIILLSVMIFCGLITGIAFVVRTLNAKSVKVIPVESIVTMDFSSDSSFDSDSDMDSATSISGEVATNVTQNVQLDNDAIISEVYVKEGDKVKTGDKLMSYDTTLTEMELEIAKLTKKQNENKLAQAKSRLNSLQNGGPIESEDGEDDSFDSDEPGEDDNGDDDLDLSYREQSDNSGIVSVGNFRAVSNVISDSTQEISQSNEEAVQQAEPTETPTETPTKTDDTKASEISIDNESAEDDSMVIYNVLDYNSVPYTGTGTSKDPYRFLCDVKEDYIIVMGSFFNKMAGYDEKGENKVSQDGPYWYRIEFLENNVIPEDREAFINNPDDYLVGYTVKKGGKEGVDPDQERHFVVGQYLIPSDDTEVLTPTPTPEPEEPEEDEDYDSDDDSSDSDEETISREEAIKTQQTNIASLELQIKSGDLNIQKLERKVKNQTILASVTGTVTTVGDPLTGEYTGDAFLQVKSDAGLYVRGSISELMLQEIQVGDTVTVRGYESGNQYKAVIREISQFPTSSSNDGYFYSSGNPNVSYYPFMAEITDEDAQLSNGEGVEIRLTTSKSSTDGLTVEAPFVRMDEGESYVYIDDNGRLKKQLVEAQKSSDGYSVVVTSGLSLEDFIAFPYGNNVVEGAKTEVSTLDALYSY